jgi:hypothetical protein
MRQRHAQRRLQPKHRRRDQPLRGRGRRCSSLQAAHLTRPRRRCRSRRPRRAPAKRQRAQPSEQRTAGALTAPELAPAGRHAARGRRPRQARRAPKASRSARTTQRYAERSGAPLWAELHVGRNERGAPARHGGPYRTPPSSRVSSRAARHVCAAAARRRKRIDTASRPLVRRAARNRAAQHLLAPHAARALRVRTRRQLARIAPAVAPPLLCSLSEP